MTSTKIGEVIAMYRKIFEERGIAKIDFPHEELNPPPTQQLEHCHGMLDQMEKFLRDGRREKAMRWVCFIQGILWAQGIYNLNTLKDHNRSAI